MAAALLHAERLRERLVRQLAASAPATAGRRFRLSGDTIAWDDGMVGGPADIVAVPTEQVLLLPVELPLPTPRRRLEALPFAIEDSIADPLDAVHVALGPQIAPHRYLAAVVRHDVMHAWIGAIGEAAPAAALVPDALLLPVPPSGEWSVAVVGERALVRSGDGTGFAIALTQLPIAWAAGGRPPVIAWSADVPAELDPSPGDPALDRPDVAGVPIDLRQGRYAYRRPAVSGVGRRVLTIAAAGIAAHGVIAAADTLVLRHQAYVRGVQTRASIAAAMPGIGAGDDAISAAAASLPASAHAGAPDPLLPLLARVAAAAGPVAMTRLDYDRPGRRLVLTVAPGTERRLASLLSSAGLSATPGPGNVVVRGGGA